MSQLRSAVLRPLARRSPGVSGSFSADPCRTTPFRSLQGRSAINEVRVISVVPDVQFHRQGCKEWQTLHVDTVLKQGDEISCDPDGSVVLAFEDNSKVTVAGTTQVSQPLTVTP